MKNSRRKSNHGKKVLQENEGITENEDREQGVQGIVSNMGSNGSVHDNSYVDNDGCVESLMEGEGGDETNIAVNGVINMKNEVLSSRLNSRRVNYHSLAPLECCRATGVQIKYMSPINYRRKNAYISTKTAFTDAEAEVEDLETVVGEEEIGAARENDDSRNCDGNDGGNRVGDNYVASEEETRNREADGDDKSADGTDTVQPETPCSRKKRSMKRSENNGCSASKRMREAKMFMCNRCGMRYLQEVSFKKHESNCSYVRINGRSIERTLNLAYDMIYVDKTVETYGRHEKNPILSDINFEAKSYCKAADKGWAKRPKWGEGMGEADIEEFRVQIEEWFNIGSACPAQKISAARMHKLLQGMNPYRYDLPSDKQITSLVTALSNDEKKARKQAAEKRLTTGNGMKEGERSRTDAMGECSDGSVNDNA